MQAGCTIGDTNQFHMRRIAAGFPLFGSDITEDNLVQEVGRTSLAISFTKGCYLGQEPIARIDAMGHVNRILCRLKLTSGLAPSPGTEVFDKRPPDGKSIGAITSSVSGTETLCLAYLRSAFAKAGNSVFIGSTDAVVL
jgi:folate-binding protein YgfZ